MMSFIGQDVQHLIATYGYIVVVVFVGLESTGIPLPGETVLIAAAIYAGSTAQLDITHVILAAATGAVIGDNLGFWIGHTYGFRLLLRYGGYLRIRQAEIKLGQYLFRLHGGKVVFFGRFVALLRTFAAVLAGTNRMPWVPFLICNMAGGVLWATVFGVAGYLLGENAHRLLGPIGMIGVALAAVATVVGFVALRRSRKRLEAEAERALPGPLEAR